MASAYGRRHADGFPVWQAARRCVDSLYLLMAGCETEYDNPHYICTQKSFNARCTESNSATNASDGVDYAVGTMVWTLFDYYG